MGGSAPPKGGLTPHSTGLGITRLDAQPRLLCVQIAFQAGLFHIEIKGKRLHPWLGLPVDSGSTGMSFRVHLLAAVFATATFGGDLQGHVRITRVLTKKKVTLSQVYERNVALADDGTDSAAPGLAAELRRVVVFIEGKGPQARKVQATVDQRKRRFEPEVVAVPAGSTVLFPNSDPVFHNVFSLSKAKSFDLGNYRMGETRQVTFETPGVVAIHCHLHPNMSAAVVVAPNAWYATPGTDGSFELKNLPPGRYTFVAWHKSAGSFRRNIEVRPGDAKTQLDIEIPVRLD